MNFPMTQPIFQFFYWLVNTPGLGGIVLMTLLPGTALAIILTLNWIRKGGQVDEAETYSFPTPALFHSLEARKKE